MNLFREFDLASDLWMLIVLVFAAVLYYGAGYVSKRVTEDEKRQTTIKLIMKLAAFAVAIFVALAAVFL